MKKYKLTTNNHSDGNKYIIKIDTFDDYLIYIENNPNKECEWIYNIIDKKKDFDRLLYETEDFVLVTEMNMNENIDTFHLLAFPKDRSLKSIRDLRQTHINLLINMNSQSKKFINQKYNIS